MEKSGRINRNDSFLSGLLASSLTFCNPALLRSLTPLQSLPQRPQAPGSGPSLNGALRALGLLLPSCVLPAAATCPSAQPGRASPGAPPETRPFPPAGLATSALSASPDPPAPPLLALPFPEPWLFLPAPSCLHSPVHRDAPRHDGADRRGRGDGLLLPRQRLALLLPGDPVVVRAEPQGLDRQAGVGLEPGTTPGETPSWAGRFPTPGRGVSLPLISSEGYGLQYVCPLRHPAVSLPSP